MNTRTTAAALAAGALLALTACTSSSDDDAKPKQTPKASAKASSKQDTAEAAFLATTRAKIPALKDVPDEQIIDLGRSSCTAIDAGNSPAAVAAQAEKGLQIGAENSGYIVGAAVSQFCPEHKSKL
ncbi:DUF732 domain-containing protein [Streptomyces sp. NPDC004250]|uniref:DUF732 domain-containing protein n=1 Tax=Streptomyces sp. NPDC004250 TaxID=3364692 RepID=UPI0036C33501